MRIAVIGMGNVGSVLGRRWAEIGYEVTFCVRDPDKPKKRTEAEKVNAAGVSDMAWRPSSARPACAIPRDGQRVFDLGPGLEQNAD
jgi:predicted dinucleotide-binding enzyme